MRSFHNKQSIKTKYLKRVIAHQKADEIIKGTYWQNGKGCAVGCTIHGSKHANYEKELGIPEWLAVLEDKIFEGLPSKRAKKWPVENHKKGSRVTVYNTTFVGSSVNDLFCVQWSTVAIIRMAISAVRSAENATISVANAVDNAVRAAWYAAAISTDNLTWNTAEIGAGVTFIKYADKLLKLLKEE